MCLALWPTIRCKNMEKDETVSGNDTVPEGRLLARLELGGPIHVCHVIAALTALSIYHLCGGLMNFFFGGSSLMIYIGK